MYTASQGMTAGGIFLGDFENIFATKIGEKHFG
jgi:hypothetical protein